jgi:uncharacterized protein (TIGR02145 family)
MIPNKFECVVEDGKPVLRTRPSWLAFPRSWILFALSLLFIYFLGGGFRTILDFFGVSSVTGWVATVVPALAIPMTIAFRRYRCSFELDQQHVRVREGYLSESDRKIQLVAWVNIDSQRSVLGRVFNYGDVSFWSGDEKSRLTWWGIGSPTTLRAYVESVRDGGITLSDDIARQGTSVSFNKLDRIGNFIQNLPGPVKSAETVINKPIAVVWEFITNTANYGNLIQGMWYWGELDGKTAKPGSTFQKGYNLNYFVVNWEPMHRFSMGPNSESWEYDFCLQEVENGTRLLFRRRFNIFGWLPMFQTTVDHTVDALERELGTSTLVSQSAAETSMCGTFTDPRDGYTYKVVRLRDGKWWLAENLRYESSGSFPADEKPSAEILKTNPNYDHRKYGRLYTWDAAQKASPPGWHLPSDREWSNMLKAYGGYGYGLGNDKSGEDTEFLIRDELNIELGGFVNSADYSSESPPPPYYYGYFYGRMGGRFWSTGRQLPHSSRGGIYYRFFETTAGRDAENMEKAFSVRCVRD